MINKKLSALLFGFIILFSLSGCSEISNSPKGNSETKVIESQGAESAEVNLRMGAGELSIDNSSDKLMDGEFIYTKEEWKPKIDYSISSKVGVLNIEQPSIIKNIDLHNNRYEWNLKLNDKLPMKIDVEFGAGKGNLNLSKLNIKGVDMTMGVGDVTIDLTGSYTESFNVDIKGGVGKTTLYLPKNIGVNASIQKGIGKLKADDFIIKGDNYVNEAYGKSKVTININIKAGIGEFNLILK